MANRLVEDPRVDPRIKQMFACSQPTALPEVASREEILAMASQDAIDMPDLGPVLETVVPSARTVMMLPLKLPSVRQRTPAPLVPETVAEPVAALPPSSEGVSGAAPPSSGVSGADPSSGGDSGADPSSVGVSGAEPASPLLSLHLASLSDEGKAQVARENARRFLAAV